MCTSKGGCGQVTKAIQQRNGKNSRCPIIVAEIGINHDGSIDKAKQLISLAAGLGIDFVKFQKRDPDICVPEDQKNISRDTRWGCLSYIEYRYKMEFGQEDYEELDRYCRVVGMRWFASAWDHNSARFLAGFNVPFIKIPSACSMDKKLLRVVTGLGIPTILSSGMSDSDQLRYTVTQLGTSLKYLLHCVASYPTPDLEINLGRILYLQKLYGGVVHVGYSNHSPKTTYPIIAASLGVEMIEFHITLDRGAPGSDHAASMDPIRAARIMNGIADVKAGFSADPTCAPMPSEEPAIKRLRRFQ